MSFVGELMRGEGIQMYYIVGILIFITLFIVILIRTIRIPKKDLIRYKTDILDDDETLDKV